MLLKMSLADETIEAYHRRDAWSNHVPSFVQKPAEYNRSVAAHFPLDKYLFFAIIMRVSTQPAAYVESWLSGLRRTTGNRVWGDTSPRVRIPNSPLGSTVMCSFSYSVFQQEKTEQIAAASGCAQRERAYCPNAVQNAALKKKKPCNS